MNKVLVIGANGFLGNKLTRELIGKGMNVIAFVPNGIDYSNVSSLDGVQCVEFEFDSILQEDYSTFLKKIDTIYNMAWVGVNAKDRENESVQLNNISYNVKIIQLAAKYNIKRLIVPGSAAEYACSDSCIDGNAKPTPSDLYSATKVAIYYVCSALCRKYKIDLIWTLITSIYGPGRDDNNLLTYVIKTLLRGDKPSTTKLKQQWDYLYIDDLINALYLIGQRGIGGKVYPVGSGDHRQMSEYVEIIRNKINPVLPIGIGDLPYKNPTLDNQVLNITELKKDTGFVPQVSFEEGIERTIDYFKRLQLIP